MDNLLDIADRIVAGAKEGEQIEAVVVDSTQTEICAYGAEIESQLLAVSQGVGVRVIKDHRQGFAYAGSLDKEKLKTVLAEARDNAELGTVDEYLELAKEDDCERKSLNLYDESLLSSDLEPRQNLALKLEAAVLGSHPSIVGVRSAEYGDSVSTAAIVSTAGIRQLAREGSCYLMVETLAREDEETETGYGYSLGRNIEDLDYEKAASQSVIRATRLLGAKKPKSFSTDIVLDPWVTGQFLSIIGRTLSGEAVDKGRSLFTERLGELVANECVSLSDNPTNADAHSATEIDGEGIPTRCNQLIQNGKLIQFLQNSYTARKLNAALTGSAVRGYSSTPGVGAMALSLEPGKKSQPEIVGGLKEGVLIQDVSGLHSGVNPISGDFSTGAEGLLIKDGELASPVREFTVGSTLQKMLLNIEEVGNDLEWLPMNSAGCSLLIRSATISGD